ncbi:MAG: histidinol-phosphatase, partial [Deltaproteobacteria bacterium]|nr:histidinol-phosphatase [Deltaproteobacteria bacterium]
MAHPFEHGSPMSEEGRAYTWLDWSVNGFDGLEIWNHSSCWKTKVRNWPTAFFHYFLRTWTLGGPDPETLAKWDDLGQTRRVSGVGGSDAHAFQAQAGPLTFCIFPYRVAFQAINTHLMLKEPLTGHLDADRDLIIKALSGGSCFIAHDRLYPSQGFDFFLV